MHGRDRSELTLVSRAERRFPFTLRVAVRHRGDVVRSAAGAAPPGG